MSKPHGSTTQFVTEATDKLNKLIKEAAEAYQRNPFNTFALSTMKWYKHIIDLMEQAVKFRVPKDGKILQDIVDGKSIQSVICSYLTDYKLPFPIICIECENEVFADHENFVADNMEYKGTIAIVYQTERENLNPLFHMIILNKCRETPKSPFEWLSIPYTLDVDLEQGRTHDKWGDIVKGKPYHPSIPVLSLYNDCQHEVSMFIQFLIALSCKNVSMRKGFPPSISENQKRSKKGKAKLNQYYDIVIETKFGEKPINDKDKPIKGIASGSKAPHLRRGHIRHYEGKNVWIESVFVNAHKGTAQPKTYRIK